MRLVADSPAFAQAQYNAAFVLMQYFGYLRRDADLAGYDFWLKVLNNREPNNHRRMMCAFIISAEYQLRFRSFVTHTNAECGLCGNDDGCRNEALIWAIASLLSGKFWCESVEG
ncbi:MAG TPA: DUF4214 domain-containing protein [Pyrinomonadaceae bacterium]|nr:DUF4214 domain-containing protein [Pyrinomonadaceae bacterium]